MDQKKNKSKKSNLPKVSVVVPTYNRANYVSEAIESVLSQTYSNIELIVVDDCSDDNTEEVVKNFSEQDSRVKYIKQEANQGAPAARNRGIREAKGKYIGLLDDDDRWLPRKLERQVKIFENDEGELGLVYGGYWVKYSSQEIEDRVYHPKGKGWVFKDLLKKCFIGSPTVLVKKECFERVGDFDEKLKSCQDWDMWLRIAKKYKVDFVGEITSIYRRHQKGQITTEFDSQVQGKIRIYHKYKKELSRQPEVLIEHLRLIVRFLAAKGDRKQALKWHWRVVKKEPFNIFRNAKICLALTFFFSFYQARAQRV